MYLIKNGLNLYAGLQKKKRPVGITVLGAWLIFQGFIALGSFSQIQHWAYVATALFALLGIGLLRLYKQAYILTLVVFSIIFIWGLILVMSYGISEATGPAVAGMILSGVIIFYLIRQGVRVFFFNKQVAEVE